MTGPPSGRRPTMTDVAEAAQVSLKTVSRFVNGERNIDPAIAVRVADAIAALHFRRNLAAASIRPGQRSQLVGLIIEDVSNPFYAALTHSVEQTLRAAGQLLVAASSEEDGGVFCRLVEQLAERRVDGLIVIPPSDPGPRWHALAAEIPALVVLDRPDGTLAADSVVADDEGGGRDGTAALIAGGARRIAFVGDQLSLPTIGCRYRGYRQALADAGLPADPALALVGVRTIEQVARAVTALLAGGPPVDAVFAANNRSCVGALQAFAGLRTRRAIVGFDDFEAAPLLDPPVTVVTSDVAEMGRLAVGMLMDRIGGRSGPAVHTVLPTTILRRGSEHQLLGPTRSRSSARPSRSRPAPPS